MRFIYCAYRDWAFKIFEAIQFGHETLLIDSLAAMDVESMKEFKPDLILFYGWSWIVKKEILDICPCVCLHPSRLPQFRGGSPLQNQILRGVKKSAVSLFYMNGKIDAGDVLCQEELSLEGHMEEIFADMIKVGIELTKKMLDGHLEAVPQDESVATYYARRKPFQSELTIEDLQTKTAEELYDFVRALEAPYPNAYIRTQDGKKLLIEKARVEEDESD